MRSPPPTSRARCRCATPPAWSRCAAKLLVALSGAAGMVSLACSAERARELLVDLGDRVGIAAVNGRSAVVVSGERARARRAGPPVRGARDPGPPHRRRLRLALAAGRSDPRAAGRGARRHRTTFDPNALSSPPSPATSSTPPRLDAEYWYRNIRQTVEFDKAVRTACAHGYRAFIEASPHPALIAGVEDTVTDCAAPATRSSCRRSAATTAASTAS